MSAISLQPVALCVLQRIVSGLPMEAGGLSLAEGALPPSHVAQRALNKLAQGCLPLWCVPFNIVDGLEALVVGGCGFKGAPDLGEVEIGYGIAPSCTRRGYGARGVSLLLEMAKNAGICRVVAHIAPANLASSALARSVGFTEESALVDSEGEYVIRWMWKSD